MIREIQESDGFLAGLIDRYAPTSDSFYVILDRGDYLKFRHARDYTELADLRKRAREFISLLARKEFPEAWAPYVSDDADAMLYVFHIAELNLEYGAFSPPPQKGGEPVYEPKGKLEHLDALRIAVSPGGHLFDTIKAALDQKMHVSSLTLDIQGVKDAEKKSSATSSGVNGSPHHATSGADTRTS